MWYLKLGLICSITGPCVELTGNPEEPKFATKEECMALEPHAINHVASMIIQRYGSVPPLYVKEFVCEQTGELA